VNHFIKLTVLLCGVVFLAGCAPKVGSDAWCKRLDAKPKGKWSVEETADYTKYCMLGMETPSEKQKEMGQEEQKSVE